MRTTVGVLFEALQIIESESFQIAATMPDGVRTEEFERISALHSILYRELKGCPIEIETPNSINNFLAPFLEKYKLKIISK